MLKGGITEIIQKYDIDASVIVKYGDKIMYQHQADKIFPAGSLIDLSIAAYIEDQWKENPDVVNEMMEVTDLSRVRGAGIIGALRRTNWSVLDLVYLISALSDNVATNLLIEKFDIYEIDAWLKDNYPGLRIGRELMRYSASGQDNECTATSVDKLITHLMTTQNPFCALVRKGLSNHTIPTDLTFYGDNLLTYNKLGRDRQARHEVCAFMTKKAPVFCTVLSSYRGRDIEDRLFFQELSELIFSHVKTAKLEKKES